jgi:NADH-quinone oxidoreductase subunit L
MQAGVVMGIPLAILAALCVIGGFLGLPRDLGGSPFLLQFLHRSLPAETVGEAAPRTEALLQIISEAASILGIPVAWLVARRARRRTAAAAAHGAAPAAVPITVGALVARFLFSGWGFDWLYDRLFVRPFVWLARVNVRDVVDRLVAGGTGGLFMILSRAFRWTQNGRVRWYAAGAAIGAVLIAAAVVVL